MANTFKNDTYRPTQTLAYIVILLLGGLGLCAALYALMSLVIVFAPDAMLEMDDGGTMNFGFMIIGLVALIEIPLRIITAVFFLIWEYRAFNNLSALKAQNLEYSPGWAVGWWFIPFANLVKPFQVMRELYTESNRSKSENMDVLKVSPGTAEIVGFWWGTFLISGFAFRISDKLIDSSGNPSQYFPVFFLVAGILHTVSAVLAIFIVRIVSERQKRSFAILETAQRFAPPPPPTDFSGGN